MAEPIRIFIGTEPKTEIARKVLEVSITRHTHAEVIFTPMLGRAWEYPKDLKVGTGFSLRRWMIAAHCQFQGKAIYLDADQLVFGDIAELLQNLHTTMPGSKNNPVIWTTHQPDKFYVKPAPQTSVMVIDCGMAKHGWGFHIDQVIAHLRANPTKDAYARFMHAEWLKGYVGTIPVEWNHLNVCTAATKLLHYTKEPEQPWYNPDHPHAGFWQNELSLAIKLGKVTPEEIQEALAKWGVKEDHRTMNGMHPFYARFITKAAARKAMFAAKPPPAPHPRVGDKFVPGSEVDYGCSKVLWVTSFNRELYDASGSALLASFKDKKVFGDLLVCTEGLHLGQADVNEQNIAQIPLDGDPFLLNWLEANRDIIPKHLGGDHPGTCACPGGPFPVHDKRHQQPCVGAWFNRNASRWFRKIAALRVARNKAEQEGHTLLVWIDADCVFKARVLNRTIEGWFRVTGKGRLQITRHGDPRGAGAFYFKHKRPVLESGIVGYNMNPATKGPALIDNLIERFTSQAFRASPRWDDCFQLQTAMAATPGLKPIDLATNVSKDHAAVIPNSPVGPFIEHQKGKHSRVLGIMT